MGRAADLKTSKIISHDLSLFDHLFNPYKSVSSVSSVVSFWPFGQSRKELVFGKALELL
jgi:hypothetical protein